MIDADPGRAAEFEISRDVGGAPISPAFRPTVGLAFHTAGLADLRPDDKGDDVRRLQSQLKALGADNVPTGNKSGTYDASTRAAVTQFQRAAGLSPADGVMNEATARKLDESLRYGSPFGSRGVSLAGRPSAGSKRDGFTTLQQGNNPRVPLGNSSGGSNLQDQGCVVTAFAMAASKLTGEQQTPAEINTHGELFRPGSGDFVTDKAAESLGIDAVYHDMATDLDAGNALKKAVDNGKPVLLRVDHNDGGAGDHTVLITGRSGDTFFGIDPAGGYSVEMKLDADGNLRGAGWRHYEATGFTELSANPEKMKAIKDQKAADAKAAQAKAAAEAAAPKDATVASASSTAATASPPPAPAAAPPPAQAAPVSPTKPRL
ncbi:MAG: peptidoglycan-binding protein [Deltaproteobacteria bacterium]|nr:peptidoglycan-binding protein [Deltaproteobacteria bacterium]